MTDTTEMGGGDVIALVDPSRWDHLNAPQLAYAYGHNDAVKALAAQPSVGAQGEVSAAISAKYDVVKATTYSPGSPAERNKEGRLQGLNDAIAIAMVHEDRATPAQPDTGGWIVGNAADDHWRTWVNGCPDWTSDRDLATRYHRREDAEHVHRDDEDAWRVAPYGKPDTSDVAALREVDWEAELRVREREQLASIDQRIAAHRALGEAAMAQKDDLRRRVSTRILAALSKPNAPGREG